MGMGHLLPTRNSWILDALRMQTYSVCPPTITQRMWHLLIIGCEKISYGGLETRLASLVFR